MRGMLLFVCVCLTGDMLIAEDAAEIFERRIRPIARSRESSCTECHFAGVDLKQYILDDSTQTFAALRDAGLINVDRPTESKLLSFIGRRPAKEDLLLAKVRTEEFAAFKAWIEAAMKEPATVRAVAPAKAVGSPVPVEVIRHARHDRVLQSFMETIWVEIDRCIGCHSPERNQKQVKEFGERVSWISPNDPAGTLNRAIEQGIIDVDQPEKSLILQKPAGLVKHGGHQKFLPGSRTDKNYRRFLNDYAAVVNETYQTARDLPAASPEVGVLTGQHLRLTDLPKEWGGRLLRVTLHRWENGKWNERPVAVGENPINGNNGMWQTMILALLPRESASAARLQERRALPGDRYQVRVFVDRENRLANNRDYELQATDAIGIVEIDGAWPVGYQPPKIVAAPKLEKEAAGP